MSKIRKLPKGQAYEPAVADAPLWAGLVAEYVEASASSIFAFPPRSAEKLSQAEDLYRAVVQAFKVEDPGLSREHLHGLFEVIVRASKGRLFINQRMVVAARRFFVALWYGLRGAGLSVLAAGP